MAGGATMGTSFAGLRLRLPGSLAFLGLLGGLSPEQRAPFRLRGVFDCPYGQVAEMVATGGGNPSQVSSRYATSAAFVWPGTSISGTTVMNRLAA